MFLAPPGGTAGGLLHGLAASRGAQECGTDGGSSGSRQRAADPPSAALGFLVRRNVLSDDHQKTSVFEGPDRPGELSYSGRFMWLEYLRSGLWHRTPFRSGEFSEP